jgi:hypothetical protein
MKARTFAHKPTVEILKFAPWQHHVAQVDPFYVSERKEEADVANAAGVIFFWADAWRDY